MVVPIGAVNVAMVDLFLGRSTNSHHIDSESQRNPRQRMVGIDFHIVPIKADDRDHSPPLGPCA